MMEPSATRREANLLTIDPVVFLQLNDVYHLDASIVPGDEDTFILPRIATVVKRLRNHFHQSRVCFCIPGDFLAPSYLSQKFHGQQMVAILKSIGVDVVSFGNHEFDIGKGEKLASRLIERICESQTGDGRRMEWLWSNFIAEKSPEAERLSLSLSRWRRIKLSQDTHLVLIGLLYESEYPGVGESVSTVEAAEILLPAIAREIVQSDPGCAAKLVFVALTHQKMADDLALAAEIPALHLIMGGHDHDEVNLSGKGSCLVVKAASNARTLRMNIVISVALADLNALYSRDVSDDEAVLGDIVDQIHGRALEVVFGRSEEGIADALFDKNSYAFTQNRTPTELILTATSTINTSHSLFEQIPADPHACETIRFWLAKIRSEIETRIVQSHEELLLEDRLVRNQSTNFGVLATEILRGRYAQRGPLGAVGLLNSGALRLGRNLGVGEWITQRTVREILYHDNQVRTYRMTGDRLLSILQRSYELRSRARADHAEDGDGHFLQVSGISVVCRPDASLGETEVVFVPTGNTLVGQNEYDVVTLSYLATDDRSPVQDAL